MLNKNDDFQREAHYAANKIENTRKRGLTIDDNSETAGGRDVLEVGQSKRAKLNDNIEETLPSHERDGQGRKSPIKKRLVLPCEGVRMDRGLETGSDDKDTSKDGHDIMDSIPIALNKRSSRSQADIEQLCANGVSELFLLNKVISKPPVMLMNVSYVLAQKIENQVSNGQAYRHARDTSLLQIDMALRKNEILGDWVLERLRNMAKLKGDRKPTPEENKVVQGMRQEIEQLDKEKATFEAERSRLVRGIELAREAWEQAALPVEDIFQDVFAQCGLIDELTSVKDQRDSRGALEGQLENTRAYIRLDEKRARRELREAQRWHEQHRDAFRRGLAAYVAGAVDRPDASKHLLEEEFSRDHIRTCYELAGLVKRAEETHEAKMAAAAEAHVSIVGPDDDMSLNMPYDLKEYATIKIKSLDHDAIEAWKEGIDANAKPNLKPAGYVLHMAEKWNRALDGDDDISSSADESVWNDGIEDCRRPSTVRESIVQPVSRKSEKAEQWLSVSERAVGDRRRRIEIRMQEIRPVEP
ncbi:hypothetical protein AA0112_g2404 [Alternaria arborescens]|nr:hypothetical protein AA0112_g2404 [Alternaria arborescens]